MDRDDSINILGPLLFADGRISTQSTTPRWSPSTIALVPILLLRTAAPRMKIVSILLSAFLLSGCAGRAIDRTIDASQLATKAVVIVSATMDEQAGRGLAAIFYIDSGNLSTQVTLRSSTSSFLLPYGSDFDDLYGNVHVIELTPGTHVIDNWQVSSQGARLVPKASPVPLKFEARAGEVLYLGNLHMHMQMGKALFGNTVAADARPEVRDRRDIDLAIAESKNPGIGSRVKPEILPLGFWGSMGRAEHRLNPTPVMPTRIK